MKKLYAGLAAAALTATGIACTAGAAQATTPWPSDLGYAPSDSGVVATAAGSDGTVYTASVNNAGDGVNVSTTTPAGTSTSHVLTLTPSTGMSVDDVYAVAITSTGTLVVSANQASSDGSSSEDDLWTAPLDSDTAAVAYSDVAGNGGVLSASPNGSYVALSDWSGQVSVIDLTADSSSPAPTALGSDATEPSEIDAIAVDNDGNAYVVGDDADSLATLWTVSAGAATPQPLAAGPMSVAVAGSKVVVGEETADGDSDSLEVFDGSSTPTSVPLPSEPYYLAVSADGNTVFGSASYDIERIDLTKLDSYTDADQVPDAYVDDIVGLVSTPDAFYAVTSAENYDTYTYDEASLTRFTKPGAVTNATEAIYNDGSIDVEWKAPADNGGSDLTYVVTLTDNATSDVITDQVTDTYDYLTSDNGLQAGHTYAITVRAENAAFSSDAVTVPPVVSGTATVTVTGDAVDGGTLSAAVTKNTFPAGSQLSYQWGYSGGNYGGAIEGATGTTYSPTKDVVGMHVFVIVTASLTDHSPATVRSNDVVVRAAAAPVTQPAPAQVTKIKPATIKASAKKVKLNLPGINVAKAPGKVKVYDGKKLIGKAKIVNGKLVLKLKKHLHHGKHKLKLTYKGSAKVAKFNKKVKLKVK